MTEETNVRTIVAGWLREHGYDGLVSSGDCGCDLDDLMPCWEPSPYCVPAYRWDCPCELAEKDGGELCPDPFDDYARVCYRMERQPSKGG